MPTHTFTVATANTHEAQTLHHEDGLKPFVREGAEILLLQEVLGTNSRDLKDRLAKDGYQLVGLDEQLGLCIVFHQDTDIQMDTAGTDTSLIHKTTVAEKALKIFQDSHRLRERGILGAKLLLGNDHLVTVATTHPIVFVRAISRQRQINSLSDVLRSPYYSDTPLVLGADMNHYPGPQKVDV
jgi:endonuclease/exonuclease/phosphatase family metal-dependent hydrolase